MPRWRILIVDDDADIAAQTAESLRGATVSSADEMADVEYETSFDAALGRIAGEHFDLLILDVRDQARTGTPNTAGDDLGSDVTDADVGLAIFAKVREHTSVPVVFFTALPQLVEGDDIPGRPFVSVVSKNADTYKEDLLARVREVFDSTLPAIHQALHDHVEQVVRDFMVDFVEKHWPALASPPRKGDLAHVLLRRLALSLADGGEVLAGRLADDTVELAPDCVHPMRYYVVPVVGSCTTGDVLRGSRIGSPEETCWYVVVTPSCDLEEAHLKAEYVVVVECVLLTDRDEFGAFDETRPAGAGEPSAAHKTAEKTLRRLLENNADGQKDRSVFLPAAWEVPDLVVDFQRVGHIPYEDLAGYERVATLDSPYTESIVEKFGRYLGRVGTPDLDVDIALDRLRTDPRGSV